MYYRDALDILNLNEYCTQDDLKKAYKKAAKQNHPDLGGSEEKMQEINEAKSVLEKWIETRENDQYSNQNTSNTWRQPRNTRSEYTSRHTTTSDDDWDWPFGPDINTQGQQAYKSTHGEKKTSRKTRTKDIFEFEKDMQSILSKCSKLNRMDKISELFRNLLVTSILAVIFIAVILKWDWLQHLTGIWKAIKYIVYIWSSSIILKNLTKSIKIYRRDKVIKRRVQLSFKMDDSGTWAYIRFNGKTKRYLISSTDYRFTFNTLQNTWLDMVLCNTSGSIYGRFDNAKVKAQEWNTGYSYKSNKHKHILFDDEYLHLDSIINDNTVILVPSGFLCFIGDSVHFIPMDNVTLKSDYAQDIALGYTHWKHVHRVTITGQYDGMADSFDVVTSIVYPDWRNLIV